MPTILLVDDRAENLVAYRVVLAKVDARLLEASSGDEALRILSQHDVALILLDVQMPGMDGFETATRIRQDPRLEHTPIVFVTAGDRSEIQQAEGYAAGAVDFLFKPLVPGILRSKVRVFLELYRKNQQLRDQARELERSNAELEQYAYSISHDLQQPVRVVSSFLDLFSRRYRGELDEEADGYIHFMLDATSRMTEQLNGLLDHSRVRQGAGQPMVPVDCSALMRAVCDDLRLMIEENEAVVNVGPLPTVQGHTNLLTQLLQNLVQNALKFRSDEPPRVDVSAWRSGDEWQFEVRDNGIGLDPRFADRIFQIFQRLHTYEEFEGTGMGLAIARKIVQTHGGTIWTESKPGEGARFCFTLPATGPDEATA